MDLRNLNPFGKSREIENKTKDSGEVNFDLLKRIVIEQLDRSKVELKDWRDALTLWEDSRDPNRTEMLRLFQEVEDDDDVSTSTVTILEKVLAEEFEIVGKDGEVDLEKTKLFEAAWFDLLVKHIIDADFYGHSLINLVKQFDGVYTEESIFLIDRPYVVPELHSLRTRQDSNVNLIDYKIPAIKKNLIQAGGIKDKGLFNKLVPLYIYKKNARQFWSNYQSKFGVPPVIAKTNLDNTNNVKAIVNFLQQMKANTFGVVGHGDSIEALNSVNVDAFRTFKELIDSCGLQIAKVLEGQTMTSNAGSSHSQSETHEKTGQFRHLGRLKRVKRVINDQLIPKMINDGFALEPGDTFRYKDFKDLDKIVERIAKLANAGYKTNPEQVEELTGFEIIEIEEPEKDDKIENSIIPLVENYYKELN